MIVRGAGAIGATGAYGMAQAAYEAPVETFLQYIEMAKATSKYQTNSTNILRYRVRI